MSFLRRVLVVVGLLLLMASLWLLVVASLPGERASDRQPLPAPDLTLPTPSARQPPALPPAAAAKADAW
ncbi:MAG: hypothetical protein JNK29_02245 [Anaerolineales bacterium]|nr:hypothetical protein [Anaerolineales bacterium]